MSILFDFLMRLVAGMSVAMAVTSSHAVSTSFFRNHLYVVLGLLTLACLTATSLGEELFWPTVGAGCIAYCGAVAWLYDARRSGKVTLWMLSGLCLFIAWRRAVAVPWSVANYDWSTNLLAALHIGTSSWLLGSVVMSMLLGHWYLNAPEMQILPLIRLLKLAFAGLLSRALVCGAVLAGEGASLADAGQAWVWLMLLRWLFGFVGLACAMGMAWQTLKIPNTQSATGLLYVAVFAVLSGEVVALLLSAEHSFVI